MARALIVVAVVALVAASVAAATTPKPDAHDRALAQQLAAKVESLKKLTATSNSGDDRITNELKGCKTLGKTPADSFAVVFAMLPVLLIDIVNEIRPILIDIRDTIAACPHNSVFGAGSLPKVPASTRSSPSTTTARRSTTAPP